MLNSALIINKNIKISCADSVDSVDSIDSAYTSGDTDSELTYEEYTDEEN
jgi:hypothetical protein